MVYEDYKHVIPIQIRFNDIDRLDHVNNSCYHNYMELGRIHYFNVALNHEVDWDTTGFVLARTEINHLISLHLQDEVYCFTKIFEFGNKSMKVKNAIVKKEDGKLIPCATSIGILVMMDFVTNSTILVPQDWRESIGDYEK